MCKTLKKEGRPCLPKYWLKENIFPTVKSALLFRLIFSLIADYLIRIRSSFFVSWSLLKKLNSLNHPGVTPYNGLYIYGVAPSE